MVRKMKSMDGNNAAAHVSYAFSEVAAIYPITRFEDVDISQKEIDDSVISCNKVMGNGRISGIKDIICVKRESFNRSEMVEMALELEKLNDSMEDSYVLVVAGRLGSSDNWLGIPCAWSQISKASGSSGRMTTTRSRSTAAGAFSTTAQSVLTRAD